MSFEFRLSHLRLPWVTGSPRPSPLSHWVATPGDRRGKRNPRGRSTRADVPPQSLTEAWRPPTPTSSVSKMSFRPKRDLPAPSDPWVRAPYRRQMHPDALLVGSAGLHWTPAHNTAHVDTHTASPHNWTGSAFPDNFSFESITHAVPRGLLSSAAYLSLGSPLHPTPNRGH